MITNYLKVALRNILRHRMYSSINLLGLALGMTCCFLTMMWVMDELSWDTFHTNAETLYRVEQDQPTPQGPFHVNITPYPMGPALKEEIPEIRNVARVANPGELLMRMGEKVFFETRANSVDPSYLEMFSFPLVKGNSETALRDPSSIVLTEEIAEKYFGGDDPIGQSVQINNQYSFTVTGIMKNKPTNTSLRSNILLPFAFEKRRGVNVENWRSNQIPVWVQLFDQEKAAEVSTKISELRRRHVLEQVRASPGGSQNPQVSDVRFKLMPLTDLRLHSTFGFGQSYGTAQTVSVFSALAIFILVIASINFMNLATAQSAGRAKAVGLRKVVGAMRSSLAGQFYGESILMTMLATLLALGFVELLIPVFNDLSGKNFSFMTPFQMEYLPALAAVALLTGIIAGTYPALFLSSFRPIDVLKGKLQSGAKGSFLRKSLVVFQFVLSVILIIGTFGLSQQLQYMRGKSLGYDRDQMVYITLRGETRRTYPFFKEELVKASSILGVSGTLQEPTSMSANAGGADWEGKDPGVNPLIGFGAVDYDYVETMRIPLVEGRAFSREFPSDSTNGVLINEGVARLMGVTSAVGKRFTWAGVNGIILGVMKDFHYSNIQQSIEPLAVYLVPSSVNYAIIRLQAGNVAGSLDQVRAAWQKINPSYPFDYRFFDEDFTEMFQSDERMAMLFRYASLFAMIVACLGLFGLASYMAEQRTREIGVRKVLGATMAEIAVLLSKGFVKWILVANVVAWPMAYFLLEQLLHNYAYRISFLWWLYPLAFLLSVGVALLTVSYQSIKSAKANPVNALKYE